MQTTATEIDNSALKEVDDKEFQNLTEHIQEVNLLNSEEKEVYEGQETDAKEEAKERAQTTSSNGIEETPLGKILPANFVINLLNIGMPVAIVSTFRIAGYETKKEEYKLKVEESKVLEQPMQAFLDHIKVNLKNPVYNLVLALSLVYASKITEAIPKAKKISKKQPTQVADIQPDETLQETVENKLEELSKPDESWKEGLTEEQIVLVMATKKRRNKGITEAIEWLKKKGQI